MENGLFNYSNSTKLTAVRCKLEYFGSEYQKLFVNYSLSDMYCIKDLNFPQFKLIFEQYALTPNLQDKNGNTLLSLAVQSNSFQISNYLLKRYLAY